MKTSYMKLYVWLTAISLLVMAIMIFISHGELTNNIFFFNTTDAGMDFFNCVANATGFSDYRSGPSGQYPPLAILFYWIILWSSPLKQAPYASINGSEVGIDASALRMYQMPFLMFTLITIITVLGLVATASYIYQGSYRGVIVSCMSITCWGCMYAIERGNIILQAYLFLLSFIVFYRSEKKWLREVGLISLAISVGLKLYPLAFIMLLIGEKRWKETIRTGLYCCISVFGLYMFRGGFRGIIFWAQNVWNWMKFVFGNFISNFSMSILVLAVPVLVVLGMIIIWILFVEPVMWKKLFLLGSIAIAGGGALMYDYAYTMLIPALLFFLKETENRKIDIFYFVCLMVIHLPLPIVNQEGIPINTYREFLMAGTMLVILTGIIFQNLKRVYFIEKDKYNDSVL